MAAPIIINQLGFTFNTILNGPAAPLDDFGGLGDFFLNTATMDLYGPKTAAGWGSPVSLAGSRWYFGTDVPPVDVSSYELGDVWVNVLGERCPAWYLATSGWLPLGPAGLLQGPPGTAGNTWTTGESEPATPGTTAGDMYLNILTGNVYEWDGEAWTETGLTLKGQDGAAGNTWTVDEGAPVVPGTTEGDLYLDSLTGDVYEWDGIDTWKDLNVSLVGPAGAAGASWTAGSGPPAAPGTVVGDLYLDLVVGEVYQWDGEAWTDTGGSLKGPDGTAGNTWTVDEGAPVDPGTTIGDLYLDGLTGEVYRWDGEAWVDTETSLQGPPGPGGYCSFLQVTIAAGTGDPRDTDMGAVPFKCVVGTIAYQGTGGSGGYQAFLRDAIDGAGNVLATPISSVSGSGYSIGAGLGVPVTAGSHIYLRQESSTPWVGTITVNLLPVE